MSFQDLEAGFWHSRTDSAGISRQRPSREDASQAVAAGIFRINTAVTSFNRLVGSIGTQKDTPELRNKLHKTRLRIGELVKDTSAKLKEASEADQRAEVSPIKKIADARLAKDFQSVLKEFQKVQRLAAEREIAYAPAVPQEILPTSYNPSELDVHSSSNYQQQFLLQESKRQEVILLENEITFNEAIIEEREEGIKEIQEQINEVNEIFKDLAILVHDQGAIIDDISSNIENSHAATTQASTELQNAEKIQKSNSSLTCLLILIFGIILLIFIIVILA